MTDRQTKIYDQNGLTTTFEARSKGALLLDNEAKPVSLWGANLPTIFNRHVSQFGFGLSNHLGGGIVPVFSVRKGMCHWEVFSQFVKRLHGVEPYVKGDLIICQRLSLGKVRLRFSNNNGVNYNSFTHVFNPYEIISKVYLRDDNGLYSASVSNTKARFFGIQRERYVIPTTEFMEHPREDANIRIRKSLEKSELYYLETYENTWVDLGDTVSVETPEKEQLTLVVVGTEITLTSNGYKTKLTLKHIDNL